MRLSEFDFHLPKELIAQSPAKPRDASRLMVLKNNETIDRSFSDLVEYVEDGDVLVINDSRVIPARIHGRKSSGGRIEILLVKEI
ncbi:MAG: S-adenosylmethionine:tRNA ribosyltransferase-isomerase, partial [Thermoplasmata archaeon]